MASVSANSERREHSGDNVSFENASGDNKMPHVSNVNDETRHSISDEVNDLYVPERHFDRQTHTHHKTGNQSVPESVKKKVLPKKPSSFEIGVKKVLAGFAVTQNGY